LLRDNPGKAVRGLEGIRMLGTEYPLAVNEDLAACGLGFGVAALIGDYPG
jgi:hypothetical protein